MSEILMIVGTRAQAAIMARVISCLSASRSHSCQVISLDRYYPEHKTSQWLQSRGIPFRFLGPNSIAAPRAGFRFGNNWHRLGLILEARQHIGHLLKTPRPGVMVLASDVSPIEKMLIHACQQRGIPQLLVQDGMLSRQEHTDYGPPPRSPGEWLRYGWRYSVRRAFHCLGLLPRPTNYGLSGCTRLAVMGSASQDILVERGVPSQSIIITGQPRYDAALKAVSLNLEPEVLRELGISPGKRLILYASFLLGGSRYGTPRDDEANLRALGELARYLGESYQVVIKAHPLDQMEDYQAHLKHLGIAGLIKLVREFDTLSLIRASSLVVTFGSTVAYEALIFRKPLILLNLTRLPDSLELAQEGAALGAHSLEEFLAAARAVLSSPEVQQQLAVQQFRALHTHLYQPDGRAGMRVATEIMALCRQSGR